jgi:hypothetical protein
MWPVKGVRKVSIELHLSRFPLNAMIGLTEIPYFLISYVLMLKILITKLRGFSPEANYTDRAAAACCMKLVLTFADRGCRVVSSANPYGRNLGFLDRSRYFFFQVVPQLYSRG